MGNACTGERNDAEDTARRERRERQLRATPKGGDSATGDYDPRPPGTDVPWNATPNGSRRGTPLNRQPSPRGTYAGGLPLGRSAPSSPMISSNNRTSPYRGGGPPQPMNVGYNPYYPANNGSRPQTPQNQLVPGVEHQQQRPRQQFGPNGMPVMFTSCGSVARRPPSTGRAGTPRGRTSSRGPKSAVRGGSGLRSRPVSTSRKGMELKPVVIQAIGLLSADELQQRQDIVMRERDLRAEVNERYWWLVQDTSSYAAIVDLMAVEQRSRFAVQRQEDASYYALIKWLNELLQEAKLSQMVADTLRRQHVPSPHRRRLGAGGGGDYSSYGASPIKAITDVRSTDQRRRESSFSTAANPPYYPHDPLPIEYSSSRRPPAGRDRSDSHPRGINASQYSHTGDAMSPSQQSQHYDPYNQQQQQQQQQHSAVHNDEVVVSPRPAPLHRHPSPLVFRGAADSSAPSVPAASQGRPRSPPRVPSSQHHQSGQPQQPQQYQQQPSSHGYTGEVPTRHTERQVSLLEGQEVQERNHLEYMEQSRFASISAYLQCDEEAALMEKIARQQRLVESSRGAYRPGGNTSTSSSRWGSVPPPTRRAPPVPSSHQPTPNQLSIHSRSGFGSDAKSASMLATQYRLSTLRGV